MYNDKEWNTKRSDYQESNFKKIVSKGLVYKFNKIYFFRFKDGLVILEIGINENE